MQYIIANWKMNGCFQLINDFLEALLGLQQKANSIIKEPQQIRHFLNDDIVIADEINADNFHSSGKEITIIMCLPFTHLYYFQQQFQSQLERQRRNNITNITNVSINASNNITQASNRRKEGNFLNIKLGAQDCSLAVKGAYTGEISAQMLKEVGVEYVIVGHAERRKNHAETNLIIRAKAQAAINADLTPIICVGETNKEIKEKELAEQVSSLAEGLASIGMDGDKEAKGIAAPNFLIAYEPIYAIGSGAAPTNEEIEESFVIIEKYIKKYLGKNYINSNIDNNAANNRANNMVNNIGNWPLIYGGAVSGRNIELLKKIANISGVLVGGASLSIKQFQLIIEACL